MMSLYRLVYTSVAVRPITFDLFKGIYKKSIENNQRNDLTGILLYRNEAFFQALEGSRVALNTLYRKLAQDERHTDLNLHFFGNVYSRIFEGWSMRSLDFDLLSEERKNMLIQKYGMKAGKKSFPTSQNELPSFLFDLRYICRHMSSDLSD